MECHLIVHGGDHVHAGVHAHEHTHDHAPGQVNGFLRCDLVGGELDGEQLGLDLRRTLVAD